MKSTNIIFALATFLCSYANAFAQDGYCMYNGSTTGGAAGSTVTVSTEADLKTYATSSSAYIINISGTITLTARLDIAANKTIQGVNTSSKINGNISIGVNNVIVRNLTMTNPSGTGLGDGLSIWGGTRVWVDHVTFVDCADGCCDINHYADYVTVSNCKFYYINQTDHCFAMILGGDPYDAPGDKLHVTLHHNWFGPKCYERMPSGSYSNAHVYNNYFSCSGNMYATNARIGTHWLVQNNYYDGVADPCNYQDGGVMQISGNIYNNCTGNQFTTSNGTVTVPYSYTLTTTASVPSVVQSAAGNSGVSTTTITSGAVYSIIAQHSGKGLDVQDASTANGGNIQQYNYVGATNQQFRVTSIDGTYYSIININSNKGLDVAGLSTANGANIQQWNYSGGANQQFKFVSTGDGYYQIVNKNSGKCLDVYNKSTANGANVQQYNCGSGTNQRWKLNMVAAKSAMLDMNTEEAGKKSVLTVTPTSNGCYKISLNGSSLNGPATLQIYNMKGQLVVNDSFSGEYTINEISKGIYLINITSESEKLVDKLLVK